MNNRSDLIAVILIIILGVVVYFNSLTGEFIWDDNSLVKDNIYIKDLSHITDIFIKGVDEHTGIGSSAISYSPIRFYRPLQIYTYLIDHSLWKLDVRGYHLTNIILHILVSLTIYWLINILFNDRIISFLTAAFFIVHPVHVEAVAYISGRADSLAAFFMLLCMVLYIKYLNSRSGVFYIAMLLAYALALLSKENSLILPVLLLFYHFTFKKRFHIKEFLPVVLLTACYVIVRLKILMLFPVSDLGPHALSQRIPGFFAAIIAYIRILFIPVSLHMEYGNRLFTLTDADVLAGICIFFLLLAAALLKRRSDNLMFFSIFWFFILLIPQSNIYPINTYMAEHWLYLPSIAFFLILARSLRRFLNIKNYKIAGVAACVFLLGFFSYLTIRQNSYWRNPLVFFKRTLRYAPGNVNILRWLAITYNEMGFREEAVDTYNKAIAITPYDSSLYNNLAALYFALDNKEEAIRLFKKAIELERDSADSAIYYDNLAGAYRILGEEERAIFFHKRAIEVDPSFIKAYCSLAQTYIIFGKEEEAKESYKKALQVNPDYVIRYFKIK
ncbi:MAG: tetratricopeptide repeat protein [Candidatus Omnitrophota bacterium]